MKKKLGLLLLPVLLLASACDTESSSSVNDSTSQDTSVTGSSETSSSGTSSGSFDSSSSSSEEISTAPVYDPDEIIETLERAGEGNYTLTSTSDYGQEYQVIFTDDYYLTTYSYPHQGVILLSSIEDGEDEKIAYEYELSDDEVLVGTAVDDDGAHITDINSNYNSLSMIGSGDYSSSLLTDNSDGTFDIENDQTTDKTMLLTILGYTLGYDSSLISAVSSATLSVKTDGSLDIQFNLLDEYAGQIDDEVLHAVISDIGNSSVAVLDEFVGDDIFTEDTLSRDKTEVLQRDRGNTITDVDIVLINPINGSEMREEIGTFEISFDENHTLSLMTQSGQKTYENYYRNTGDQLVDGVEEGDAYSRHVSTNNGLIIEDTDEDYDSVVGDRGASKLDDILSKTYPNHDGSYTYHGEDADEYLVYLTGGLSLSDVSYLTFEIENDQVSMVTARYGQTIDETTGITYYAEVTITFSETNEIAEPEVFSSEANSGDYEALESAFEKFNQADTFSYTYYDADERASSLTYDRTTVYVSRDDYILTVDYNYGIYYYTGTKVNDDGTLTDFELTTDEDGNFIATRTRADYEGELSFDHQIDIDPLVLESDGNGNYTPRPYVTGFAESILSGSHTAYLDDSTFSLTLDDDGNIGSYTFYYNIMSIIDGTDVYEFTYGEDASLPEEYEEALENIEEFEAPTTWENSTSVYNCLVTIFGEDVASTIPYLYYEGISDSLTGYAMVGGHDGYNSFVHAFGYVDYTPDIADYIEKYFEYLEANYSDTYVEQVNYYINYETYDVAYVNQDAGIVIIPNRDPSDIGEYGIYFFKLDAE